MKNVPTVGTRSLSLEREAVPRFWWATGLMSVTRIST